MENDYKNYLHVEQSLQRWHWAMLHNVFNWDQNVGVMIDNSANIDL